jgi:hypothetical protein
MAKGPAETTWRESKSQTTPKSARSFGPRKKPNPLDDRVPAALATRTLTMPRRAHKLATASIAPTAVEPANAAPFATSTAPERTAPLPITEKKIDRSAFTGATLTVTRPLTRERDKEFTETKFAQVAEIADARDR